MDDTKNELDFEPIMMTGTGGRKDYLVIAGQGSVALGIKPNAIAPGDAMGKPGTVWFGARLRSAKADASEYEAKASNSAFKFTSDPDNLYDCWPGVVWEKKNSSRASTTIGGLMKGTFGGTRAEAQDLIDKMRDGRIGKMLADYLYELCGTSHMLLSKEQIAEWLTVKVYRPAADNVDKSLATKESVEQSLEENVGSFGMMAAIMNKAYKQAQETTLDDDLDNDFDNDIDDEHDED